jgi:signal transduction histidine kinase
VDITERIQAEQALARARDQALEASHLKSQLLAKVSHELRTPLGAILGYTELLRDGIFGPLPEQPVRVLTEVIDSTDYLTALVNELLDQAQFESGRIRLKIGPFELREMAQRVEARMDILAQAKGLALTMDIAPELPDVVIGDENRLQQILVNLVSNSIKFTKSGAVQIHLYQPDPAHWVMAVTDTGPGIPEEAHSYIFEPFRQVDGSMTREHLGAGLGLAIVKQLTNLMGGQISLESEVGRGSTFTILLPLAVAD